MWAFDSFAKWVVVNPIRIKSSRKVNNVKDTTPPYKLTVDKELVDFGSVRLGNTTFIHMVRVTNTGYKPVFIPRPEVPSEFRYVGEAIGLLYPGQEAALGVEFSPKSEGEKSGVLLIKADPLGTISVDLRGFGKPYTLLHNGLYRHNGTQQYNGDAQ